MYFSVPVAYFLWFIGGLGALGLHRFYLRKTGTGLLWLVTGGLGMFGSVYDFLTLSRQVEEANIRAGMREALELRAREPFRESLRQVGAGSFPDRRETIEKIILRTARKNGGYLTPGEVAIEGDVTADQARTALDKLAGKGYAQMRVRTSGVIVYAFRSFSRTEKPSSRKASSSPAQAPGRIPRGSRRRYIWTTRSSASRSCVPSAWSGRAGAGGARRLTWFPGTAGSPRSTSAPGARITRRWARASD